MLKTSIDKFVARTVELNPDTDAKELKMALIEFKNRKAKGELCICGNPIWIIGSAITGKGCFTCITGEADSSEDYEIA